MANWIGGRLTKVGNDLQIKVEAGLCKLELTKIKLGDGTEGLDAIETMTDLVGPKAVFGISSVVAKDGMCTVTGVISSSNVTAAFYAREWGIFAKDPDRGEILYMISLDPNPESIPPKTAALKQAATYAMNIVVANAANIEARIDPQGLVTTEILEKAAGLVRRNMEYFLNDKVFDIQLFAHPSWRLVCTKAGTTSGVLLNLHGAKLGDTYADGTAEWTVKDAYEAAVDAHNKAPDAHADIRTAISNAGIAILQRSRAYQVGDIAYHKALPSWARLECVRAGTTGAELPDKIKQTIENGGVIIHDGTVVWIIDDLRDGTPVGAVRGSLYLPAGYVKANGATVQRSDYPRLVALADRHNLWTDDVTANAGLFGRGDGAATMVLPNWTDRMVQLAGDGAGASVAAGLPNIHIKDAGLCAFGEGYAKKQKNGVIYTGKTGEDVALVGQGRSKQDIEIDVSTLNPIYGASATVQPAVIKLIPVIRY